MYQSLRWAIIGLTLTKSDLPINCHISELLGTWTFTLQQTETNSCPDALISEFGSRMFTLSRTVEDFSIRESAPEGLLFAASPPTESGTASWSPLYHEGLIVQYNTDQTSYLFYGKFDFKRESHGFDVSAAQEDVPFADLPDVPVTPNGATPGFTCSCNMISRRGWVIVEYKNGVRHLCEFEGQKEQQTENEVIGMQLESSGVGASISPHVNDENEKEFVGKFRKFDDRRDKQPPNCGSCFVYAFAYAFENSIAWRLSQLSASIDFHNEVMKWNLDRTAMLECAFSSEKCKGGFFESLTFDMITTGIQLLAPGETSTPQCGKHDDEEDRVYPKRLVQLQSETEIMHYIETNGPVLVGVYMEKPPNGGEIVHLPRGSPNNDPYWDYLNHGLVITGWGKTDSEVHFWTAVNSWGMEMRIHRGEDSEWFYKYAVAVVPDFCRGKLFQELLRLTGNDEEARRLGGCQSAS